MTTEIFTRQEFEQALPQGYWQHLGLVDNEHVYQIKITDDIFITIRSSVDSSGYAAKTGQDSIRAWLVKADGSPLGSKVSKYTTRVKGWDRRLLEVLRTLWGMARLSGYCPTCGEPKGVFKVRKSGPTKGRLFSKCEICNTFDWLEG